MEQKTEDYREDSSDDETLRGRRAGRGSLARSSSGLNQSDGERRSSSAGRDRRYNHRYHDRDAFDPPPDPCAAGYCGSIKQFVCRSIDDACTFWRRLRGDRFRWELFKSVVWFTIGLKLFNDISRHINDARQRERKSRCRPRPKHC